ncbi:hypothetical protein GQ53DRAFT_816913 [Thozetella sp. PMI_491]|nr:hypothetical protein GQ53DRAFT_816913 [Thozetella sp. PMI_491]
MPEQKAANCELFGGLFLGMFMPEGCQLQIVDTMPGGWVCLLPSLFHGKSRLISQSLLALYTGFVGRTNGDDGLLKVGIELYGHALHMLNEVVRSFGNTEAGIQEALASSIILTRFELFTGEGKGGYLTHIKGGMKLLEAFCARLPRNELTKTIVKKFRILGWYVTMRHREDFFMSRPPFSSLYLAEVGDSDYIVQKGFETVIKLPTLAWQADKLDSQIHAGNAGTTHVHRVATSILTQAKVLAENLEHWCCDLTEKVPSPEPVSGAETPAEGQYEFGSGKMHYGEPGQNYIWILYWLFSLYLHRVIKQVQARHAKLSGPPHEPLPPALLPGRLGLGDEVMDQYADNISKSLFCPYQSTPLGAQETIAPMLTLQWYYEHKRDETKTQSCIARIKRLEQQGLSLNLQVHRPPGAYPRARARFLAES